MLSVQRLSRVVAGSFARRALGVSLAITMFAAAAIAAEPVVKTVPWIAADTSIPHDTYAGARVTLKGTSSLQGSNMRATWDFGDGSPSVSFSVENGYDVSATHRYSGAPGTTYTARLTVSDIATGESSSATYAIAIREKTLDTRVNLAIDEGLWYLHKTMARVGPNAGYWQGDCAACDTRGVANAWNVLAFERHGHLESGDPANPYTETVARGLAGLFQQLESSNAAGSAWLEAVAAANSPNAVATTGPANIAGRTYKEILQIVLDASGDTGVGVGSIAARKSLGLNARSAAKAPETGGDATSRLLQLALAGSDRSEDAWKELEASILNRNSLDLDSQAIFNFAQAMRLHAPNGKAAPVQQMQAAGETIDWYAAEVERGASTDGVAKTLVGRQSEAGSWTGHGAGAPAASIETAQSLLVLLKTPVNFAGVNSVINVSPQVSVVNSGYGFVRATSTFNGVLTVTNTSAQTIPGPITVGLVNMTAGVTLVNASGTFNGAPYVSITPGSLAPGAAASAQIRFSNPSNAIINYGRVTYSGLFPPAPLTLGCPASAATLNAAYSSALSADGGVQLYTYSISAGSLPSGLSLNPATGAVTGTPDTVGTSNFTATVADSAGATAQAMNAACSIVVPAANNAPTANAQSTSTNEDTSVIVTLTGSDPDGNSLAFTIATSPSNGSLGLITPVNATSATVTYTPALNYNGADSFSFQVSDGLGGTNSAAVSITVNPVNDPPSFTKGANQTVLEDSGAQSVPGWATGISPGPADEAGQTLTFNVTGNTNAALFSVAPAVAADGTLSYTPAANAFGTATITLTLSDNGGTANGGVNTSAAQTFDITITGVNDVPSFTKGSNQTVNEDAGAQTVVNWATAISAGAGEGSQTVSFVIASNDNPGLFSAGPAISSTGTLTYTPGANKNGVANLTVYIQDDGGTANGGVDQSATQSFTITVNAVNDKPFMTGPAKSFNAQANMRINGLGGLLTGASDANDPENTTPVFTVGAIGGAAAASVVNLNAATGSFDFDPAPGVTGAVTFNYLVCDNGVPAPSACSDPITVTVNIAGPVIWFVNSAAAVTGNGTLTSPFKTMAEADAVDNTNHRVFLHAGTYSTGLLMNSGEWLIGQGVTGSASFDALMGITPPVGTVARPSIGSGTTAVQGRVGIATNAVVRALAISVTGSTRGLTGASATGVSVSQTSVSSGAANAVQMATVGGAISLISVSSNGAPSGIDLSATTGSFEVIGTGAVNTGGLIQNSTGDGVLLNNVENVTFKDIQVLNSVDSNLDARTVNGLTLDRSTFSGTTGGVPGDLTARHNFYGSNVRNLNVQNETMLDAGSTNMVNVHNVKIDNLLGTSKFTRSTIRDGRDMNLLIENTTATNYAGAADTITIENNMRFFNPSPGATPGDQVQIRSALGGNMSVTVQGGAQGVSQFTGASQNCIQLVAEGIGANSGKMTASISNATMTGANGPAVNLVTAHTGSMTATVTGLTLSSALSTPININNQGTSTLKATISSNTINVPNVAGNGITAEVEEGGTLTARINNNTVTGTGTWGIRGQSKSPGGKLNLTIEQNTVTLGGTPVQGIAVEAGSSSAAITGSSVCLNMLNNNSTANGVEGYRVRVRAGHTFQLQGFAGSGTSASDVSTYLTTTKSNVGTKLVTLTGAGAAFTAATCAVP